MDMERPRSGWTFWRVVGLIVGLLGMAGFGFCSLCGLVMTSGNLDSLGFMLMFILPGLGLTFLSFLLARAMNRRARMRSEGGE